MLLVSDNTAVRMCGRVVPALEINEILAAKGFVHTRVEPVANPNRFYLGTTTPREMHDLLWRLATKTLLSPASCDFLLSITRWLNGYHDGVRRVMSSRGARAGSPPSTAPTSTRSARPGTRPASCSARTACRCSPTRCSPRAWATRQLRRDAPGGAGARGDRPHHARQPAAHARRCGRDRRAALEGATLQAGPRRLTRPRSRQVAVAAEVVDHAAQDVQRRCPGRRSAPLQ